MNLRCWQCGEHIDTISAEKYIYRNVIRHMESMLCLNARENNNHCDSYRHEDCRVLQVLIQEYKERL
jgi:hypothetical protein